MKKQNIVEGNRSYEYIGDILLENQIKKYLLVGGFPWESVPLKDYWDTLGIPYIYFNGFTANPLYESVAEGVRLFRQEACEMIVAIGGGSAIDVAKCIKLYSNMDENQNFLEQEVKENSVKLAAIPTTAGTGSESTRFAVIYYKKEKQSISHESIIPDYVILEPELLTSLPLYQKKSTMLDAFCQAIESMWSVHSTPESTEYSKKAIRMIMDGMDDYLTGIPGCNGKIMKAANLAGRAINITQTTAAHAMSYKITSLFGIPHGHAVALCLPHVWRYMNSHPENCVDPRGIGHLERTLQVIAQCMGVRTSGEAVACFERLLDKMEMNVSQVADDEQLELLAESVNPVRLVNNPVRLDKVALLGMYREIFS